MKKILLTILPLLLVVGCSADPIDGSTLIEKGGLMYAPYSGEAVWYYEDGQKWTEGTYKDGKLHGLLTVWYENGQKEKEGTYKDGKLHGLLTGWHENGQKSLEGTYKDGELISSKIWNEDGSVKE